MSTSPPSPLRPSPGLSGSSYARRWKRTGEGGSQITPAETLHAPTAYTGSMPGSTFQESLSNWRQAIASLQEQQKMADSEEVRYITKVSFRGPADPAPDVASWSEDGAGGGPASPAAEGSPPPQRGEPGWTNPFDKLLRETLANRPVPMSQQTGPLGGGTALRPRQAMGGR